MANGFGSLYIGTTGIKTYQNALNTTANNLANVDTKGYVRQQVVFSDKHYTVFQAGTTRTNVNQSGLGVDIGDVAHVRDIFLDKAYRLENGRQAFYDVCHTTATQVEDQFQEMNGEEFKQCVQDLSKAFQELAKAPGDSVNQNLVIQKSELFLERAKTLYADLQGYQANMNEQIKEAVERVNEIGKRIYDLNLYVQKVECSGVETAMTARDERDALLDELSTYGTVATREDSQGFLHVDFQSIEFVQEYGCNEIALQTGKGTGFFTPYWPQLSDIPHDNFYPVFSMDGEISAELNSDIGSIKALLYQRGDNYGRWSDIATEEAYAKIQDCTMMETEAELDMLVHTVVSTLNDLFCPNIAIKQPMYYYDTNGMLTELPAGSLILDVNKADVGADKELPPQELFTRNGTSRYTTVKGEDGKNIYIYNPENIDKTDTIYQLGSIEVNLRLKQQETLLPTFKQDGAVDYGMAQSIVDAWQHQGMSLNPNDKSLSTFEEYYDKMIIDLGTKGNIYNSESETLLASAASLDNQRTQVMGVSSDEELTKMIRYQSAYNAASRYISVISEMTQTIVSGLI